jgi:hypothetical protein
MAESLHPRTQWFKTAQTAIWIFEVIKTKKPSRWVWDASRRSEFPTVAQFRAHTNSGKCSQNRDGHGSADSRPFDNCRKYLGREIRILDPDIIVTQGRHARAAVEAAIEWKEIESTKLSFEPGACNTLVVAGHPVLWITMHHPNPTFSTGTLKWRFWGCGAAKTRVGSTAGFPKSSVV